MASLRDIKRRINSVKSTQKITRAMKMVAASKLRRAQEAILQARPYAYRMRELANSLALRADSDTHPLLRSGGGKNVELVVITSDRGLCGGFNANIINRALDVFENQFKDKNVELTIVGRKGIEGLKRRHLPIRTTFRDMYEGSIMHSASTIVDDVVGQFIAGEVDEIHCLYNEFKSAISQKVTLERILPFEPEAPEEEDRMARIDYLYEPSEARVIGRVLTEHMAVQMHRILFESSASEHGARMTAMDSATNNAGDVINRLTLQYNRARQNQITTELIEVISGAEAL
ncbi:MAG: ATP synthase F1 subunit gamma [Candidatus Hydrogenedentota bacterium]